MTIRQRLVDAIAPDRARRLGELESDLAQARKDVRTLRASLETFGEILQSNLTGVPPTPFETAEMLQEGGLDEVVLQQLLYDVGYEQMSGGLADDSREREGVVKQAERLFRYSPLAQWSIWLWTGWGLGDAITVTLENDKAQETWDEFAGAERNEKVVGADQIHKLSDWLLVKGNRFLALFTATAGEKRGQTTVRVLDQDELTLVANPEDKADVWFYRRRFTSNGMQGEELYYPSTALLLAPGKLVDKRWSELKQKKVVGEGARRADEQQAGTAASVFHIAHNEKDEVSPWGWPVTTAAGPWVRGHKQFSEARLGVAMAISQFVRRTRVKGGSRAVASVIGQIASTLSASNASDTNPPATAGSWDVENQTQETKELPMRTGASDAKDDNAVFAWMAGLGMGVFPTSMGLDTSRWATAVEMDKAQAMLFERYQRFWTAQIKKLVRTVLMLADRYAGLRFTEDDVRAEVSTDTFSLSDYPAVSEAVANQVEKMLTPYLGVIPEDTVKGILAKLWRKSMDALGSEFARDLTTDEAFGVGEEEEEPSAPALPVPAEVPEPGMEPEAELGHVLDAAVLSLERGEITPEQFAEFGLATIADAIVEARDGYPG